MINLILERNKSYLPVTFAAIPLRHKKQQKMQHTYDVNLTWENGRIGELESSVLNDKIKVATPPDFPNGVAGVWSPEHFFVAAINSCLMTTFLAIAENSKLEFGSFDCSAKGILAKEDGKFKITEVSLSPVLEIHHERDIERAGRIIEKAEAACLISNSITSKINLNYEIKVAELV